MKKMKYSPDKWTFKKTNRLAILTDNGTATADDVYFNRLLENEQLDLARDQDTEWQKNNLEYTLRTTDYIIEKVVASDTYAQNLYAALCNNQFIHLDNSWNILKENYWNCSWKYAGGIIADMIGYGDYMDWYCSGIPSGDDGPSGNVHEGKVTDEIRNDLRLMGWVVITK